MSLLSKVVEVVGKAVGDMGEADKVDGGRLSGGVPQEEVDKVMTLEAWYYSPEDYAKFTPFKKQKQFQLMRATKAVTAITLQLLAIKNTCLRSQGPD
jgi:hypothetical protein